MRWVGVAYRAHDPRWSWAPLSGDGAAAKGGRFNPAGVQALYLAQTIEGMFLEMSHGLARRFEPLTACSYEVDVEDLVDLRTEKDREHEGIDISTLACPWALDRATGRTPASWALAERLMAAGAAGLLVPSFAVGATIEMTNLVLWRWGNDLPHSVHVHDPSGRLPRDAASWSSSGP